MAVLESDYWATPTDICVGIIHFLQGYGEISWGQYYDLDCCANLFNTKVRDNFITEDQDAMVTDWNGKRVWCNPPYSRGNVDRFVNRAIEQTQNSALMDVVMLINVDVSTKYFKRILEHAKAIVYVTGGRINFIDPNTMLPSNAPKKPNMFVLFSSSKKPDEFVRTYYADLNFLRSLTNGNPSNT